MNSTLTQPSVRRRGWIARRGMTLMEVMVALVILTGALLGMGRFITSFSHATTDGALSSTASDLVLDRLEYLKATTPYTNLSSYAGTEAAIPGYPNYTRITQVLRTNTASTDYTAITVTVSHPSLAKSVKKTTIISAF
jgi:prepilin-type N-terminal cleavage/methylation domain-containing protein